MAKKLYEEASVQAIANAIRAKNGSTATYKVAQMADAVLAIAPLQPDVEEYPQMSTTVAAYLTAAEAAYTDANGGSVSVLDSYTGASGIKDAPLGKALTMQGGTRYQQDETTGIGGKLNNILGGESVIYNAVPGHVLRYIVKGSGGDVIDSGRVKPTGTVRMMKFIGYVKNCRDLGGWACDGGTVRYGRNIVAPHRVQRNPQTPISPKMQISATTLICGITRLWKAPRLGARCITSGIPCRPITATSLT